MGVQITLNYIRSEADHGITIVKNTVLRVNLLNFTSKKCQLPSIQSEWQRKISHEREKKMQNLEEEAILMYYYKLKLTMQVHKYFS